MIYNSYIFSLLIIILHNQYVENEAVLESEFLSPEELESALTIYEPEEGEEEDEEIISKLTSLR